MSHQWDSPQFMAWQIIEKETKKTQRNEAACVQQQGISFQEFGIDFKKKFLLDVSQCKVSHVLPRQLMTDI